MNTIPENYPYITNVFFDFLNKFDDFKTTFQAWSPDIYADIESSKTNPNCSCRKKVEEYIKTNSDRLTQLINGYIKEKNIDFDTNQFTALNTAIPYHGVVETVKISEWKNYVDDLMKKRAIFRSFSVVKIDDETVNVFFL
jgi:hypothetical protein